MKTIFIPVRARLAINNKVISEISKKLPKNLALVYSIQYSEIALQIKRILSKSHEITKFSQVLGCSKLNFPKMTKAILLIGSGRFHGVSLAAETKLPVFILEGDRLSEVSKKEVEDVLRKRKASYLKFFNSEKIGILVSTKPGQRRLNETLELTKKLDKEGKQVYIFLGDNISSSEFENYDIQCWINTACPKLDLDYPILNLRDIKPLR